MKTIYYLDITAGAINFDHATASRIANECHAPNAKQYFTARGKDKPKPITVRGWPFSKMYLTYGDAENGAAVAWA